MKKRKAGKTKYELLFPNATMNAEQSGSGVWNGSLRGTTKTNTLGGKFTMSEGVVLNRPALSWQH